MQGDVITLFVRQQHNFCHRWLTMMLMPTKIMMMMAMMVMMTMKEQEYNDDEEYAT